MAAAPATLPQAQQRIFDKMGREFDNRDYTKALRSADSILSIVPDHADTVAMKGLTLHSMDRKEEGYELIKKAIALCPRSTIAWHSLGMCQRTDRNYAEALKAFKQALVTDPNNANVLRDISSACIQVRDWEQFLDTREKMVTQKASIRANWIALSCGHRILGNVKLAAAVMDVMTSIMDAGDQPVEVSEAQLFRVELELESGAPQRALELLRRCDAEIKDEVTKLQLRAKAHALLGQKVEAEKRYMELIGMGFFEADSIAAIAQLRKIPLDDLLRPKHDVPRYMEVLEQVLAAYPKCDYARRHALDCVPVEEMKPRLQAFAAVYIRKMIPSLFSVLKSLYTDPARAAVVGEVFHEWEAEVEAGDFHSFGDQPDPTYVMWIRAFLASHYRRLHDYAKAHEYIDKAIKHTPTLETLYVEKARIYAREGNTGAAAAQADLARQLDLQDKYLNSKAAKYFFRDNQIEKAEATMQLFYKAPTVPGDTYLTALESQCSWYEVEVGEAFYRRGDCISALQNLLMFEFQHRQNICELNDFHNYVFRRNTMRAWFNVIDSQDHMERNKFFLRFCPGLVRTYMKIDELGEEAVRAAHQPRPSLALDTLSSDDAKRMRQLVQDNFIAEVDISAPLEKAARYMGYLLAQRPQVPATHVLAVEFFTRLQKPLLVARALLALKKLKYSGTAELVSAFETGLYAQKAGTLDSRVVAVVDELLQLAKKN